MCVCVYVSFYYLLRVCVRAGHSFYFVVSLSLSRFSFSFIKNSLIYSQLTRKKNNSYIIFLLLLLLLLCACVLIPTRLLCVRVVSFPVDYRWVSGYLYFIYLYVCYVWIWTSLSLKTTRTTSETRDDFVFSSNTWRKKPTELDFSCCSFLLSFAGVIIYLYVYVFIFFFFFLCICKCYFQFWKTTYTKDI